MVKKILSIVLWVITAAALVVLFIFARENYLTQPVKDVSLDAATDTGFVRRSDLHFELKGICDTKVGTVNMVTIQDLLDTIPWIASNASFVDLDGVLHVNFKEYDPKFRVFGKKGKSVYVTENGMVIPTSRNYTPYVLVASGNFDIANDTVTYRLSDTLDRDRNLLNALHWCKAIESNSFIRNCVGQLYCNNKNEFELMVKGLNASVTVGDTCLAADKLKRLETFIKQRIDNPETYTFKNINLNYKNQIVCTKR